MKNQILMTENYDFFKFSKHNRKIAEKAVKRLMTSLTNINLSEINPILVNEKNEIIDGQHRLEALRRLKLPVYYIRWQTNSHMDDAIINLNANQRGWTSQEYVEYWANRGKETYQKILECQKAYQLPLAACVLMVTNITAGVGHELKTGKLKTSKVPYTEVAKALNDFFEIFKYAKSTYFIRAFAWLYRSGHYNHKIHFDKFVTQRYKMKRCADKTQYIQMFEEILNYHKRGEKIVLTKELSEPSAEESI